MSYSASKKGKPYQIYSEINKTGKNISGAKRRVSWRFGWSEENIDHEVILSHTITSGKKVSEDFLEVFVLNIH